MLRQFVLGIAISVCNIAIHAMVMVAVIRVARIVSESATSRRSLRLTAVMGATASVLMAAHLAEVASLVICLLVHRCCTSGH
mgnify:CR=1 FL=1